MTGPKKEKGPSLPGETIKDIMSLFLTKEKKKRGKKRKKKKKEKKKISILKIFPTTFTLSYCQILGKYPKNSFAKWGIV